MSDLFTADFFCEVKWTEPECALFNLHSSRVDSYHGRFSKTIARADKGTKTEDCPWCGEPCPQVPGSPLVYKASNPPGLRSDAGVRELSKAADLELAAIEHGHDSPERAGLELEAHERSKVRGD